MDFSATALRIQESLEQMQLAADGRFDLELPVEPFTEAVKLLSAKACSTKNADRIERINRTLKRLSRILLPAFETSGGRYAQDRYELEALDSPIPAVHDLSLLAATPPDAELSHLLYTELMRERNRLSDALRWATVEILETVG
jgi:hypothetical protein